MACRCKPKHHHLIVVNLNLCWTSYYQTTPVSGWSLRLGNSSCWTKNLKLGRPLRMMKTVIRSHLHLNCVNTPPENWLDVNHNHTNHGTNAVKKIQMIHKACWLFSSIHGKCSCTRQIGGMWALNLQISLS